MLSAFLVSAALFLAVLLLFLFYFFGTVERKKRLCYNFNGGIVLWNLREVKPNKI